MPILLTKNQYIDYIVHKYAGNIIRITFYNIRDCILFSSLYSKVFLKVTYHENLNFSVFKCSNQVPGASTKPENVKKNNPVFFFSLQACEKNSCSDFAPPVMKKGVLIIILPPL